MLSLVGGGTTLGASIATTTRGVGGAGAGRANPPWRRPRLEAGPAYAGISGDGDCGSVT